MPHSLPRNWTIFSDTRPQRRSFAVRCFFAMLPVSFFLFILSYVPLPSSISKTSGISAIVSRLTVIGTVILGLLSGFGSINNAWDYLPILSQNQKYDESFFRRDIDVLIWRRIPADDEVSASERALAKVQQDLADRRADLLRRESLQSPPGGGWLSRVTVNFRGGSGRFLSGTAR